jgi:hypothetical protein
MSWQNLLQHEMDHLVIPWLGGRRIHKSGRTWRVTGRLPGEFGWYLWECQGRRALLVGETEADQDYEQGRDCESGYLVGDRFIALTARVEPDPARLVEQTVPVYLVEPGLSRFAPIRAALDEEGRRIYIQEVFGLGPEEEVREAYVDRKGSVAHISDVPPALDLAFRFASQKRLEVERRRAELVEEARREEAKRNTTTGLGRRTLAEVDPEAAARAALRVGGAELLDVRDGRIKREMVVQYRVDNRRLECVAQKDTLRVVDAGICLEDHATGEKGDTYFTLESLPAVVRQAIGEGRLVVWRHVDDEEW